MVIGNELCGDTGNTQIGLTYLHAGVVHNHLVVENVRIVQRCLAAALEEEAISGLHDVGFVNRCHLLTAVLAGVLKGILGDTCGCRACDDLQSL